MRQLIAELEESVDALAAIFMTLALTRGNESRATIDSPTPDQLMEVVKVIEDFWSALGNCR